MLFAAATGYALQALAHLPEGGGYVLAGDLAEALDLPGPFLSKILQNLAKVGILESVRGPKGGFRLARPAKEICVGEVVDAVEGPGSLEKCVMGFPMCDAQKPCPMHDAWNSVKTQVEASLTSTSLKELHQTVKKRRRRKHS
jgi:Rrf2 family transcriptional regulator, iron-sulfur cluster assembly transcription factor